MCSQISNMFKDRDGRYGVIWATSGAAKLTHRAFYDKSMKFGVS